MPIKRPTHPLDQSRLYKLTTKSKLAGILGIEPAELRRLTRQSASLYREMDLPKKNGTGTRHIEDPCRELKLTQAKLAKILSRIRPPDYLFCPVKGRDYVKNAAQHKGNRIIRCLDVRKYFPSTSARRVFRFFRTVMQCNRDVAGALTSIACYQEHLPTGSPLSPILSYFAHIDVWEAVAAICNEHGYVLTVYIDDVTVSGANVSAKVMWDIKRAIHRSGLRYHKEKIYVDRPAEITGVIVDGDRVAPPHRQFRKIHTAEQKLKMDLTAVDARTVQEQVTGLRGQLAQIRAVEGPSSTPVRRA